MENVQKPDDWETNILYQERDQLGEGYRLQKILRDLPWHILSWVMERQFLADIQRSGTGIPEEKQSKKIISASKGCSEP